jgi:hypothetical protein
MSMPEKIPCEKKYAKPFCRGGDLFYAKAYGILNKTTPSGRGA